MLLFKRDFLKELLFWKEEVYIIIIPIFQDCLISILFERNEIKCINLVLFRDEEMNNKSYLYIII